MVLNSLLQTSFSLLIYMVLSKSAHTPLFHFSFFFFFNSSIIVHLWLYCDLTRPTDEHFLFVSYHYKQCCNKEPYIPCKTFVSLLLRLISSNRMIPSNFEILIFSLHLTIKNLAIIKNWQEFFLALSEISQGTHSLNN